MAGAPGFGFPIGPHIGQPPIMQMMPPSELTRKELYAVVVGFIQNWILSHTISSMYVCSQCIKPILKYLQVCPCNHQLYSLHWWVIHAWVMSLTHIHVLNSISRPMLDANSNWRVSHCHRTVCSSKILPSTNLHMISTLHLQVHVPLSTASMKVATTVFVGNISDKATDTLIRQMLLVNYWQPFEPSGKLYSCFVQRCGTIVGWKRVQDASGKLQGMHFSIHIILLHESWIFVILILDVLRSIWFLWVCWARLNSQSS